MDAMLKSVPLAWKKFGIDPIIIGEDASAQTLWSCRVEDAPSQVRLYREGKWKEKVAGEVWWWAGFRYDDSVSISCTPALANMSPGTSATILQKNGRAGHSGNGCYRGASMDVDTSDSDSGEDNIPNDRQADPNPHNEKRKLF